jgi:hypothetical protein
VGDDVDVCSTASTIIHQRTNMDMNMKAATLLILVGLTACGGSVTQSAGDGNKDSGHDAARRSDAASDTGSGTSSPDASPVCTEQPVAAKQCLLCKDGWSCPGAILPQCPFGVSEGMACFQWTLDAGDSSGQCFDCPDGLAGQLWGCAGSTGWTPEEGRPCGP